MSTYYLEIGSEKEAFVLCSRNRVPLLLKGPTGSGKSQFVQHMAEELKRPLVKVSCNEDTTAADLIGRFIIQNMDTVWQDGPVTRAVRTGAILYLDEIAEAREDVIVALHPLTDQRRELYIDRLNETLRAPDEFFCVASFNPGYQSGLRELKPSTRQRFVALTLNYPSPEQEEKILTELTGLDRRVASKLVAIAGKIRNSPQFGLRETVSTRSLVHTATLIQAGMPPRRAGALAIAESLTDDPSSVTALRELVALHL